MFITDGGIVTYKYDHNDLRVEKDVVVGTDHRAVRYYYDGSLPIY